MIVVQLWNLGVKDSIAEIMTKLTSYEYLMYI